MESTARYTLVIIDITGVKLVDAHVADTLLRAARARRTLGARAVLTGIGPRVAEALVDQNIDFSAVVTRGTLQDGIAHALRHSGERSPLAAARS